MLYNFHGYLINDIVRLDRVLPQSNDPVGTFYKITSIYFNDRYCYVQRAGSYIINNTISFDLLDENFTVYRQRYFRDVNFIPPNGIFIHNKGKHQTGKLYDFLRQANHIIQIEDIESKKCFNLAENDIDLYFTLYEVCKIPNQNVNNNHNQNDTAYKPNFRLQQTDYIGKRFTVTSPFNNYNPINKHLKKIIAGTIFTILNIKDNIKFSAETDDKKIIYVYESDIKNFCKEIDLLHDVDLVQYTTGLLDDQCNVIFINTNLGNNLDIPRVATWWNVTSSFYDNQKRHVPAMSLLHVSGYTIKENNVKEIYADVYNKEKYMGRVYLFLHHFMSYCRHKR